MSFQNDLKFRFGKEIDNLKFATFKTKYDFNDTALKDHFRRNNGKPATKGNKSTEVKVLNFTSNIDDPFDSNLDIITDYHTYLMQDGNIIGYFMSNIAIIGVESVVQSLTFSNIDFPTGFTANIDLASNIPISYKMIVSRTELEDPSNVDLYTPLIESLSSTRYDAHFNKPMFDSERFPFLSETESYHVYLYTKNFHNSSNVSYYEISNVAAPSAEGNAPSFDLFKCVDMNNLETGNIILNILLQPNRANVLYYLTAHPEGDSLTNANLYQDSYQGTYQTTGNVSVSLNKLVDDSSFVIDSNVTVTGIVVDEHTGEFSGIQTEISLVLDKPVISNIIAVPFEIII
jgi:hypothetical protein